MKICRVVTGEEGKNQVRETLDNEKKDGKNGEDKGSKNRGNSGHCNENERRRANTMVDCLTEIFNQSQREGKHREEWKISKLVLLVRKRDKRELNSYRPYLQVLSKILTRIPRIFDLKVRSNFSNFKVGSNFSTT